MEIYRETQRLPKGLVWGITFLVVILLSIPLFIVMYENAGKSLPVLPFILAGAGIASVTFLMHISRLDTSIDERGVVFYFYPFQFKEKKVNWDEVLNASIRKYDPYKEFGGRGFRAGFFRISKAYTMKGQTGLQLVLKDGNSILLGTADKEKLRAYLQRLKERYTISVIAI